MLNQMILVARLSKSLYHITKIKHTCTIIISCAHTHRNFQEIKIYHQYSLTIIYDQFVVLINTIIYCTQCLLYSDK